MNSVHIDGRLTADPEIHRGEGKKTRATFSIARNGGAKNAEFFDVVLFGDGWIENLRAKKGDLVAVEGRLTQFRPNGGGRAQVQIVASEVRELRKKEDFERAAAVASSASS